MLCIRAVYPGVQSGGYDVIRRDGDDDDAFDVLDLVRTRDAAEQRPGASVGAR